MEGVGEEQVQLTFARLSNDKIPVQDTYKAEPYHESGHTSLC
jgi:hypothetical protein